jgi:6-phosphogluconolactonase
MALVTVLDDLDAVTRTAGERVTTLCEMAKAQHGSIAVCLTGGRTAAPVYSALADPGQAWRHFIDWRHMHVFWGDERHVPPSHPDSNFGMAAATLLSRVPVPASQIHRIRGELTAEIAAETYERELREGFELAARVDPTFDVTLLGVGGDAHIASIFPASPALENTDHRVVAVWAAHLGAWRITLTPPALLASRHILLIVTGAEKADAVAAALEGPLDVSWWPAQCLRSAGDRVEWIIDRSAARGLREQYAQPPP